MQIRIRTQLSLLMTVAALSLWVGALALAQVPPVAGSLRLPATTRAATRAASAPATPAYLDVKLSFETRVADLVGRMTLEEKAAQAQMLVRPNARLGLGGFDWWTEAIHGVSRAGEATVYPHAIALAATWNPKLIEQIAEKTSDEARAKFDPAGVRNRGLTLWCPSVDLVRDPRWGRIQETYGEDPFLAARMGVAFCKGLQGDDPKYLKTVATPKHFALHGQETGRTSQSFNITEAPLRDYYLPAFYACFTEGKAASTMVAHNGINKIPCHMNRWLLTDLLRNEWGFTGAVVSDVTGVSQLFEGHRAVASQEEAVAAAMKAGVDVICNRQPSDDLVASAVRNGLLPEAVLNRAVARGLLQRFRLGLFDPPEMVPWTKIPSNAVGRKEHVALALQSARESIVLLQNNPAPAGHGFGRLLPLDLRKINSIAVVGPYATRLQFGNYSGIPANPAISPADAIEFAAGPRIRTRISRVEGPEPQPGRGRRAAPEENEEAALELVRNCDVAIVVLGINLSIESEGIDRQTLELPAKQKEFLRKVVEINPLTVLIVEGAGGVDLRWAIEHVPAILQAWYPGEQGGNAIADILVGKCNPSGRLPLTFYREVADLPPLDDYEIEHGRTYMYFNKPVIYPFGYGLSYSSFGYGNLRVEPAGAGGGDVVSVSCDVTNTGQRDGDEVVQLYVRHTKPAKIRPLKQLKAFERVTIPAGATRTVRMQFRMADLGFWDVKAQKYVVESGEYELMVGASSADIRLRGKVSAK